MSEKHTPGPWIVCGGFTPKYTSICTADRQRYVVWMMGERDDMPLAEMEESRANARLIAAAPALLEACKEILSIYDCLTKDGTEPLKPIVYGKQPIEQLRAAIALAQPAEGSEK